MKDKHELIKDFFNKYEESANTFDVDLTVSLYADTFMSGEANGVTVGKNDAGMREAMTQRKDRFQAIGFQKASLLDMEQTWLGDHYVWAKTKWRMDFTKKEGAAVHAIFDESYFLYVDGRSAKVVFFVAHKDELQTMKDLGLIK